jgi:tRNA (mo5U34)-methyltransferase
MRDDIIYTRLMVSLDARRNSLLDENELAVCNRILLREIQKRKWYHKIKICEEIVTPGFEWDALWDNTRAVRSAIDYQGKSVLDLGSWDGLWAFEAEALGASLVVATDCNSSWRSPIYFGLENFLLVREAVFSNVIPLWNVAPNQLTERLSVVTNNHPAVAEGFDIVHHLGLLYHLRDPFYSLSQARAVLKDGGTLLLEAGVHTGTGEVMHLNSKGSKYYHDYTTWWLPTVECCMEMLRMTFFEVISHKMIPSKEATSRVSILAKAVPPDNSSQEKTMVNQYILDSSFDQGFGEFMLKRIPCADLDSADIKKYYGRPSSKK